MADLISPLDVPIEPEFLAELRAWLALEAVTAAFDPAKHPRNPATGRDDKESPDDGGKFTSKEGPAGDRGKMPWKDTLSRLDEFTRADVEAGKVPGLVQGDLREGVAAHARDVDITLGKNGYLDNGKIDTVLVAHEAGHYVANEIQREAGEMSIPELEPFRKDPGYEVVKDMGDGRLRVKTHDGVEKVIYGRPAGYENPWGLNPDPGEILADTYSELLHAEPYADQDDYTKPRQALLDRVAKTAKKMGLPHKRVYRAKLDGSERITAAAFDPAKHPHEPAGSSIGGRWAKTTGASSGDLLAARNERNNADARIRNMFVDGGNDAEENKRIVAERLARRLADDPDWDPEAFIEFLDPDGKKRGLFAGSPTEVTAAVAVNAWAVSSSDTNPRSLLMQRAAADEFGLDFTVTEATIKAQYPAPYEDVLKRQQDVEIRTALNTLSDAEHDPKVMGSARAFVRAQYAETQDQLARRGLHPGDTVSLYRGMGLQDEARWLPDGFSKQQTQARPLSSWSTDYRTAAEFGLGRFRYGGDGRGLVLAAQIPVERIVATPFSGVGCLGEQEVVVAGRGDFDDATVFAVSEARSSNFTMIESEFIYQMDEWERGTPKGEGMFR